MKRTTLFVSIVFLLVGNAVGQEPTTPKPRVYLQSQSKGNSWAARRDQSMEMAKDFQKDCPDVIVTVLQEAADYTILLNHIEVGLLSRDNQVEVANRQGDMLRLHEGAGIKSGSIRGSVEIACKIILEDWRANVNPQTLSAPVSVKPAPVKGVSEDTASKIPTSKDTIPEGTPPKATGNADAAKNGNDTSISPPADPVHPVDSAPAAKAVPIAKKCAPPQSGGLTINGAEPREEYCPKSPN